MSQWRNRDNGVVEWNEGGMTELWSGRSNLKNERCERIQALPLYLYTEFYDFFEFVNFSVIF